MEELINRIINIEDLAKAITSEAYENKIKMQDEISSEIEEYKLYLQSKEERKIGEMTDNFKETTITEMNELSKKLSAFIEDINNKFQKNKEFWENEVFQSVIE